MLPSDSRALRTRTATRLTNASGSQNVTCIGPVADLRLAAGLE